MAVQNPFFGKRDNDTFQPRQPASVLGANAASAANAINANGAASAVSAASASASPGVGKAAAASPAEGGGSKLTVGPNIKLKGVEITDCDTLVVEGTVEATMDSRVIQISEQGAFRGNAEIDIAEIRGAFDGTLTVRQKLVIFGTGKVSGKIRYGKVVIEEGGQLTGDISAGDARPHAASAALGAAASAS